MINLLELKYCQDYLHSPHSWLHKMAATKKIAIILSYIAVIYTIPLNLLLITLGIFAWTYLCLLIKWIPVLSLARRIAMVFPLLIGILFLPCDMSSDRIIILRYQIVLEFSVAKIPTLDSINVKQPKLVRIIKHTSSSIANFIVPVTTYRITIILASYLILYKLISMTSSNNNILFAYFKVSCYLSEYRLELPNILFTITLSADFIRILELKTKNIATGIYLRGICVKNVASYVLISYLCLLGFYVLFRSVERDVKTICRIMYLRQLEPHQRSKWLIK
jgi:energy-coupling factor transporter transmembrane protein EcfT